MILWCRSDVRPAPREMRPRPAHNGDAGALYDLTKHRDSPAAAAAAAHATSALLLRQGCKAPPGQGRGGGGEMNFSLYGCPPYNPVYISHDKLNHALASPAPRDDGGASRGPSARQVPPAMPLDVAVGADDGPGKPTSVIVEHRTPARQHQQVRP